MYKLFTSTLVLILIVQFYGLFYTVSKSANDFLYSPQKSKNSNISIVNLDEYPTTDTLERLISVINSSNPIVIGLNLSIPFKLDSQYENVVSLDQAKRSFYDDNDGVVRSINCPNSFALTVSRYVDKQINCFDDNVLINHDINEENIDIFTEKEVLKGETGLDSSIVLIGLNGPFRSNRYKTPTSRSLITDTIIEADAINTLITGRQLRMLNIYISLLITATVLSIFCFILAKVKYLKGLAVLILFIVFYFLLTYFAYLNNIILDFFYIPFGLIAVYITQLAYGYFSQHKSKLMMEFAFGKYLNPKVLEQLLNNPKEIDLGGERRLITTFFVDIKSFSTIAEKKTPDNLVAFLNNFLSFVSDIIVSNDGTLDKYVGDEVMAFWNAPVSQYNHSILAAKSAISIKKGIHKIVKHGVGIGINTGVAFVGNIGSQYLYDYTAIGDNINITSRLEKLTRLYNVPIIVSESFVKSVVGNSEENIFRFRLLDDIKLRGKTQEVKIYELVGYADEIDDVQNEVLNKYEEAYQYFKDNDYKKSLQILSRLKNDPPSVYLLKRIKEESVRLLGIEPRIAP